MNQRETVDRLGQPGIAPVVDVEALYAASPLEAITLDDYGQECARLD